MDTSTINSPSPNQQIPTASNEPLILSGPLDQYAAQTLKTDVLRFLNTSENAVLDFGDIDRMHAASLQVLLALQKDLSAQGRKVILKSVDSGLRKIFNISGTESFFEFSDGSH